MVVRVNAVEFGYSSGTISSSAGILDLSVVYYMLFLQFCDAGIGYGESGCGISSSKILIKGGTVVNAHHQEVSDVYVEDGIIAAVKPNIKVLDY